MVEVLSIVSLTRKTLAATTIFTIVSLTAYGQDAAGPPSQSQVVSLQDSIETLQKQTSEMKSVLEEMKAEVLRLRTEASQLRQESEATRQQLAAAGLLPKDRSTSAVEIPSPAPGELLQNLEEEQELLKAKVEEQHQTKVESASRYRVRLSGAVLLNLFRNRGAVDNLDFPGLAVPASPIYPNGSFGASVRQSLLGLEVFGPQLGGARVSADIQFDFAGGFPNVPDGVTSGLPRLRTAGVRMAWPRTTLVVAQDAPFFSPLSPSSIASLAVPAFSYSGNLWTWIPQVRLERRLDLTSNSNILLQGGIMDPLTGERPAFQFLRTAQAGEASRQPAYATRISWSRHAFERDIAVGIGSYYSRQDWGSHRNIDSWVGTSDWTIPVSERWEVSGEFYRGRAIGGLGGGIGRSVLFSGAATDPAVQVKGLNSTGGWTQIKFRHNEKLEWNGAFGQDNLLARDLRPFPLEQQSYYASIARNRSSFLNFIYHLRSDVLFSVEYRRHRTFTIRGDSERADLMNFSMGVLF